jgi:hypothetical protein
MAGITPEVIDRLHANLLTSGVQQQNQALFFVIDQLINAVRQSLSNVQALTGGGGGGGGGILAQSFLTMDPDGATLPNSAQFVTHNLNINRSGNKFTVNAPVPYPHDGEDGEMGMIGPPGIQGMPGLMGPIGPPGMDAFCEGCCESLPTGNGPANWIGIPYDAADFTGDGTITWGVDSADVTDYSYKIIDGNTVILNVRIENTDVSGAGQILFVAIPPEIEPKKSLAGPALAFDNGTGAPAFFSIDVGTGQIQFVRVDLANWAASTDSTSVYAVISYQI